MIQMLLSLIQKTPQKTKIRWFWKSNDRAWDDEDNEEWTEYSDAENLIIERDFKAKKATSRLTNYEIDFSQSIQSCIADPSKQRKVRRAFCLMQKVPTAPCWYWKSNALAWDGDENEEWTAYADGENLIIERDFEAKKKISRLTNYEIDFSQSIQSSIADPSRQRKVKRTFNPTPTVPCWYWKSNALAWDGDENEEWTAYADGENLIIERDFEEKKTTSRLANYDIDFTQSIQSSIADPSRQRKIKRVFSRIHEALTTPCWYWKSNALAWDGDEDEEWTEYAETENLIIERDFKGEKKNSRLTNYEIDFNQSIQSSLADPSKQRKVKRAFRSKNNYSTGTSENSKTSKQPNSPKIEPSFYFSKISNLFHGIPLLLVPYFENLIPELITKAADGLLALANPSISKEMSDAQAFSKQLKENATCRDRRVIGELCTKIYSMPSFVSIALNKFLRETKYEGAKYKNKADESIGKKVGPFVAFLHNFCLHPSHKFGNKLFGIKVYRGCTLSEEEVREYKKKIGGYVFWESFSSTSKSLDVARCYVGNVLFSIQLFRGADVSTISHIPVESEVLLHIHFRLKVLEIKEEYDRTAHKTTYIIDLEDAEKEKGHCLRAYEKEELANLQRRGEGRYY